jgi:16S rRNA C967 or C1407 C5-methylase (RsmB/RsmF family)
MKHPKTAKKCKHKICRKYYQSNGIACLHNRAVRDWMDKMKSSKNVKKKVDKVFNSYDEVIRKYFPNVWANRDAICIHCFQVKKKKDLK